LGSYNFECRAICLIFISENFRASENCQKKTAVSEKIDSAQIAAYYTSRERSCFSQYFDEAGRVITFVEYD